MNSWPVRAILLAAIVTDLILLGLANDLSKSDWAAWVQAVGSIVAILGAVWATIHSTSSERRARMDEAKQAAISQLVFARAVLIQAKYATRQLCEAARAFDHPKIEVAQNRIGSCLGTLEGLFGHASNQKIDRVLASAYANLVGSQAQGMAASSRRLMDVVYTEVSATFNIEEIEKLITELDVIGREIGAPEPPAEDA